MNLKPYHLCAPIVLRIGISLVFLWFGLTQLFDPEWGMAWLPEWAFTLPIQATTLVFFNGLFEALFGLLLLAGFFTRIVALLLGLHLIGIIFSVGYNDVAVRDFGLMLACVSIALHGSDDWCVDQRWLKYGKE